MSERDVLEGASKDVCDYSECFTEGMPMCEQQPYDYFDYAVNQYYNFNGRVAFADEYRTNFDNTDANTNATSQFTQMLYFRHPNQLYYDHQQFVNQFCPDEGLVVYDETAGVNENFSSPTTSTSDANSVEASPPESTTKVETIDNLDSSGYTSADSPEEKPTVADLKRPDQSYVSMIAQAILTSPCGEMPLSDIYKWIESAHPYFKAKVEGRWKNSVRHALSLHDCFVKRWRPNYSKGHFWSINPVYRMNFLKGDYRKIKRGSRKDAMNCFSETTPISSSTTCGEIPYGTTESPSFPSFYHPAPYYFSNQSALRPYAAFGDLATSAALPSQLRMTQDLDPGFNNYTNPLPALTYSGIPSYAPLFPKEVSPNSEDNAPEICKTPAISQAECTDVNPPHVLLKSEF